MPKKKVLGIMFLITYFQKWKKKKKQQQQQQFECLVWVCVLKKKFVVNIIWVHGFQNNYNNVT